MQPTLQSHDDPDDKDSDDGSLRTGEEQLLDLNVPSDTQDHLRISPTPGAQGVGVNRVTGRQIDR